MCVIVLLSQRDNLIVVHCAVLDLVEHVVGELLAVLWVVMEGGGRGDGGQDGGGEEREAHFCLESFIL